MLSEKDLPGKKRKAAQEPKCRHCEKKATQDDYCYGCKEFVCNDCCTNLTLMGNHNVEDHWTITAVMK